MPNKNYISGRNFEYRVKKYLESKGYLVFRTAGSHSIADLIVFPRTPGKPVLIQCKHTGIISKKEKLTMVLKAHPHNCLCILARMDKRKLVFTTMSLSYDMLQSGKMIVLDSDFVVK